MSTAITEQLRLPAVTWSLDPVHSSVGFAIKYMVSTFRTTFDRFEATLDTTGDEPRLSGAVDPSSIVVKDENFKAHLVSPDFFDVQNHPRITFESTAFRQDGDELVVEGDLTIKGNTHRVEGRGTIADPHEDIVGNTKVGVTLEAEVDRTKFGLSWNAPLPRGGFALANEVALQIELELIGA